MAPESSARFGRAYSRHDKGTDAWSSSGVVRLLAGCALCVAGVIAIVPRAGNAGGRGLSEGLAPSGVFLKVRVPAATVPVSIGRVIGAGPGSNSKLDAQVTTLLREVYLNSTARTEYISPGTAVFLTATYSVSYEHRYIPAVHQ